MDMQAEQELRRRVTSIPLQWREDTGCRFTGSDREEYEKIIVASHVVADEGRLAMHRWIDAGRRAGLSWSDIGGLIGVSKQAAQQRFRSVDDSGEPADRDRMEVRTGATAFNEMRIMEQEGLNGRELVRTGMLALFFRATERQWEYRRIAAVSPNPPVESMSREGWTYVSSWFPFQYFKRVKTGPGLERAGTGGAG